MQSSRNLFSEGMKNWSVWLREDNVIYSSDSDEGRDGFTSDPASAVSFLKTDGKSTLRLSGEWSGGVTTKESFSNYHLSIYYRWGEKVWERTEHEPYRDSGILFHCFGEQGGAFKYWMKSVEYQIRQGTAGDLWVLNTLADAPVKEKPTSSGTMNLYFDPNSNPERIVEMAYGLAAPKILGQWNHAEIYAFEDSVFFLLNGEVTMAAAHLRKSFDDGGQALTSGPIQLQSDGAEIFFQDMIITPIFRLPLKLKELRETIEQRTL